jgi:hypothetical protein
MDMKRPMTPKPARRPGVWVRSGTPEWAACPPRNPRWAYDIDGREIPPMTLATMRENGP